MQNNPCGRPRTDVGAGCWIRERDREAQTCCITLELYMMDFFNQKAAGNVVLAPRCGVFLQVTAAGETEDILRSYS